MNNSVCVQSFKRCEYRHKHNSCLVPKNISVRIAKQKLTKSNSFHIFAYGISSFVKFKNVIGRNHCGEAFKLADSSPKLNKRRLKFVIRRFEFFSDMNLDVSLKPCCNTLRQKFSNTDNLSKVHIICHISSRITFVRQKRTDGITIV